MTSHSVRARPDTTTDDTVSFPVTMQVEIGVIEAKPKGTQSYEAVALHMIADHLAKVQPKLRYPEEKLTFFFQFPGDFARRVTIDCSNT